MQACPLYLSEMAPSHLRGSLNICFQLATAVGILAANSLNYGERHEGGVVMLHMCWRSLRAKLVRHVHGKVAQQRVLTYIEIVGLLCACWPCYQLSRMHASPVGISCPSPRLLSHPTATSQAWLLLRRLSRLIKAVTLALHGALVEDSVLAGTSHLAPNVGWRLSLGLVGVPAVLVLLGSLALPETPSSLMQRGREQEARKVCIINGSSASYICAILMLVGSLGRRLERWKRTSTWSVWAVPA